MRCQIFIDILIECWAYFIWIRISYETYLVLAHLPVLWSGTSLICVLSGDMNNKYCRYTDNNRRLGTCYRISALVGASSFRCFFNGGFARFCGLLYSGQQLPLQHSNRRAALTGSSNCFNSLVIRCILVSWSLTPVTKAVLKASCNNDWWNSHLADWVLTN